MYWLASGNVKGIFNHMHLPQVEKTSTGVEKLHCQNVAKCFIIFYNKLPYNYAANLHSHAGLK